MESFNIVVHRGGRGGRGAFTKKQYIRRELRKKGGGLGQFAALRMVLAIKKGECF